MVGAESARVCLFTMSGNTESRDVCHAGVDIEEGSCSLECPSVLAVNVSESADDGDVATLSRVIRIYHPCCTEI